MVNFNNYIILIFFEFLKQLRGRTQDCFSDLGLDMTTNWSWSLVIRFKTKEAIMAGDCLE